ncbi:hypothetical protein ACJJTC_008879 [Scirpophaga incertulas]
MFIKHSKAIYGLEFLVYNVHMLCHISDDTRVFGALDDFSAFPFENYLGALKNLVRSPNKPLQQIVKRLLEMESSQFVGMSSNDEFVSYPYESGPVPHEDVVQTKCLVIPNENDSSFVCFPLLHAYGDK